MERVEKKQRVEKQIEKKIGLIGAGRIAKIHAANIAQFTGVRLHAVSDPRIKAAQDLAEAFHVPHCFEDSQGVLNLPELDAVLICSSTDTHADFVERAATARKHIFCEKPLDLDLQRIRSVMKAVEKAGVHLQMGFNRRFDPNFRSVALKIREGKIGAPHLARISSRDPEPPPLEYVKVSGGIFMDMMIHDFDMARFLLQDDVVEVYATGQTLINPEFQKYGDVDTAVVTLTFASGAMCVIDNSRQANYGYDQRIEVFGPKGCMTVSNTAPDNVVLWNELGGQQSKPHYFFLEKYEQAFRNEMQEFVSCLFSQTPPSVSGIDGLHATAIACAAKKSYQEKRTVNLKEIL